MQNVYCPSVDGIRATHYAPNGRTAYMRIPETVLKCVGYVMEVVHRDESGVHGEHRATGFFVSVPGPPNSKRIFLYFVTAKHVAERLQDRSVYFLVNARGGGTQKIAYAPSQWWTHPSDETADVALVNIGFQENIDIKSMSIGDFVAQGDIDTEQVSVGDEVFMPGLFTEAPGTEQNIPIVRHGNIAMFPRDQIQTEYGYADAYLIETRSIGGLSGSPVFVRPTVFIQLKHSDNSVGQMLGVGNRIRLMGLMHGHWNIRESEINEAQIMQDRKRGVNLGIGIVVPAQKIIDTINHPELIEKRREVSEFFARRSVPGVDLAESAEEKAFTAEDFEAALKKASRRVK